MYFKRLEMHGFKSFADPVTIEFNDGITCIVGPNGSGKSNISDALRWVLGEQSPRLLRGGKMEEVIFAGTTSRKPRGMAEVTLVIDNTTNILPLEYNEVAVTRRIYRSGESEYLINGNQSRMRDIKELFMDTGIGVDGYSIIGQGKIADIVSTKPENRREIFEEAAGVVLYKSRKAEAARKLKSADDNLERVKDIIAEIEGRIGGLKKDSKKAQEYIELRDRYKYLEVNIILHNIENFEKSVSSIEEDLKNTSEEYNCQLKNCSQIEEELEQLRIMGSSLDTHYEEASADLLAKIEDLNIISSKGQINNERLKVINRDLAKLELVINDSAAKLKSEKSNLKELEKNAENIEKEKNSAEEKLNTAVYKYSEHTNKKNAINEEIEKLKSIIIDANSGNVSKQAEIKTLENYKVSLNERKKQLDADFSEKDVNSVNNSNLFKEIEEKITKKSSELEEKNIQGREINKKLISANHKLEDIGKALEENRAKINRSTSRMNTIEEMENNYEGYNTAVRSLMKTGMRGIEGTVSDLIRVPEGYEIAIETALGGALQNIVCDNDSSAKAGISWLKDNRAGRATFLPVSSVRSYSKDMNRSVENSAGYLGIASERIECDTRYRDIADYLLGRVIIVDNMDNAVSLSKRGVNGFRFVTLDGEVVKSSGAITGGKYRNNSANLLERKKEIAKLAENIDSYVKEAEELEKERSIYTGKITELKNERIQLLEIVQQFNIDLNVMKSDREHLSLQLNTSCDESDKYNREIETIQADLKKVDLMIEKYSIGIKKETEEAENLKIKVEELLIESEKYKDIVEDDNEDIIQSRVAVNEQETKILGVNELIERVNDTIIDLQDDLDDAEEQKAEFINMQHLLSSTGDESGEKESRLKEEKAELEDLIKELSEKSELNKNESNDLLIKQKKTNASVSELQDKKYKLEIKAAKNDAVLSAQKDKLWDEFELSYIEALDMKEETFVITSGNKDAKEIRLRLSELGDVNISSIEEYKKVSKRYEFMTLQEEDITKAMDELESIIKNMDRTIKHKFKDNFDKVVINFENIFKELFGGGYAELRLEDEANPLESGIEIIAQPPGKKLRNINLMSGGEKTMTAIALMFAVLKAKPTPFCILDEVEAALDEANIDRFSNYLKNFDEVQFALVTHQKATMEHADVLYGVTMPEHGISKVLSLKLGDKFDFESNDMN